jgi:ABC-type Fe3+/spermidine/putrescine transport system ATPase subunit
MPGQLSGGMQQRVALARALVIRPRVLLLDEPLAALDRKLREAMRAELKEIQRAVGITTIFVTHDQQEALGLSDRVAVMHRGRIEQLGAPREVYERPATAFVADFIGASSVLDARAVDAQSVLLAGGQRIEIKGLRPFAAGESVRLLVRPERVQVGGGGPNTFRARVAAVMFLGDHSEVRLALDGGVRLLATVTGPTVFEAGDTTSVTLPADAFQAAP